MSNESWSETSSHCAPELISSCTALHEGSSAGFEEDSVHTYRDRCLRSASSTAAAYVEAHAQLIRELHLRLDGAKSKPEQAQRLAAILKRLPVIQGEKTYEPAAAFFEQTFSMEQSLRILYVEWACVVTQQARQRRSDSR
eukprot:4701230-Amphidinium_carterae.1